MQDQILSKLPPFPSRVRTAPSPTLIISTKEELPEEINEPNVVNLQHQVGGVWNGYGGTSAAEAQLMYYDFTLFLSKVPDRGRVVSMLTEFCRNWVFQKEVTTNALEHWQGRMRLKSKDRLSTLKKKCYDKFGDGFRTMHLSPTSNENKVNNFYVMKEETRVSGPYSSESEPLNITESYLQMKFHLPWMDGVISLMKTTDYRNVYCLLDFVGGHGKSYLAMYLHVHKQALCVPPMASGLVQYVSSMYESPEIAKTQFQNIFVDIGRSMLKSMPAKDKEALFASLETIKNGYLYDTRHKGRCHVIERPNIWVCMNQEPLYQYLSEDRWVVFAIDKVSPLMQIKPDPLLFPQQVRFPVPSTTGLKWEEVD